VLEQREEFGLRGSQLLQKKMGLVTVFLELIQD
jgi:hypothetical protein